MIIRQLRRFGANAALAVTSATLAPAPPVAAQDHAAAAGMLAERLSRSAQAAALRSGTAYVGAISCDAGGFVCACEGAFDCAWLAYGCSVAGGIRGFDGECYFPARDPAANRAALALKLTTAVGPVTATCDGIFCSCSGGAASDDCQQLSSSCLDDVTCIGENCGCIGGTGSE